MEAHQLTENLYVACQITPAEVNEAAEQGFNAIINNRPDHEEAGQPAASEVKAAAQKLGIQYIHQPVVGSNITPEDIATFSQLIDETPGKILAHCRTGTRCTMLWLLSQAGKRPVDELLKTAKNAGYDLEMMRERLTGIS